MDYSTLSELQQNQVQTQTQTQTSVSSYPPSSAPSYPNLPPSSDTTHYLSYPQNPYPPPPPSNSNSTHGGTVLEPPVHPPGVDSYASLTTTPTQGHETIPNFSYGHTHVVDSNSLAPSYGYYYLDPNAQNWAAREAVRQYGVDPVTYGAAISMPPSNGSEQLAIADPSTTWWTNTTPQSQPQPQPQPHGNGTWKKYPKKVKTKTVQSAYCEVCKIECTSKDVLDQHKLGKKHKKNLEKLRESLLPPQVQSSGSSNPVIGPQEQNKNKPVSGHKSKRKTAETPEDLEKKKMKVLEGGAAAEAVRICSICNVVCNSETVFNHHLAGQKHAAMVKKASEHTQSKAS